MLLKQLLDINGKIYELVVQGAEAEHRTGMLLGRISEDGKPGSLIEGTPSESLDQMKNRLHHQAYRVAGVRNHVCNNLCRSWFHYGTGPRR
jgi:hypothetical protein